MLTVVKISNKNTNQNDVMLYLFLALDKISRLIYLF